MPQTFFDPLPPPMSRLSSIRLAPLSAILLPVLLSACAAAGPARMTPFASDGCSMFPDRAPIGKADWCACCVAHDLAYWRGGSAEERLRADEELAACVRAASKDAVLAEAMLAGVRAGGVPYFPTGYRWGYGWPYGRGYAPLSPREDAEAMRLRARYMTDHQALACPGLEPTVAGR